MVAFDEDAMGELLSSRRDGGQSLVELGMILVLVAVVLLAFFTVVGARTNRPIANVANQMEGQAP